MTRSENRTLEIQLESEQQRDDASEESSFSTLPPFASHHFLSELTLAQRRVRHLLLHLRITFRRVKKTRKTRPFPASANAVLALFLPFYLGARLPETRLTSLQFHFSALSLPTTMRSLFSLIFLS